MKYEAIKAGLSIENNHSQPIHAQGKQADVPGIVFPAPAMLYATFAPHDFMIRSESSVGQ